MKTITEGFICPWGFFWFRSSVWRSGFKDKRYLGLAMRLPFYFKGHDFYSNQEVWGSLVLRVLFFQRFQIIWVPDYEFCSWMEG